MHLVKIINDKGSFAIAVIALIVVLVLVLAFAAVLFLPVKAVNFDQTKTVSSVSGVDKLNLKLNADLGEVRVIYTNLTGQALNLHVVAKGAVGYLMNPETISLDFIQSTSADTAIVNASLNVKDRLLGASNLKVRCDVLIGCSMRSKLDITSGIGSISVNTTNASALDRVVLSTSTGAASLHLTPGVNVYGDISITTNVGAAILVWNDPIVKQDIKVVASAKTGGVELNLSQSITMNKNVSLNGTVATGGVDMNLNINGNIGAEVNSSNELGGVHISKKVGFTGSDRALTSTNYPASGNFVVHLETRTGGVEDII
jgi:hypothetical protein